MTYYSVTGAPVQDSRGTSPAIRAEYALIAAGFAMLPVPASIWGGSANYGVDTGSANAYVVSIASTYVLSYTDGLTIKVAAVNANTGAATINLNALGVKSIVRPDGTALQAGDIAAAAIVELTYNATLGKFQLFLNGGPQGSPGVLGGTAVSTVNLLTGANIASAATVNLDTATGNRVHITGTTTITAVTLTRGPRTVIFDGILTLTHHATNNNLPGAANITTAAGDRAIYESDGTTVYCVSYIKASGAAVVAGGLTFLSLVTASAAATVDITSGFSSTYDDYLLVGSGIKGSAASPNVNVLFKIAGSFVAAGYDETLAYNSSLAAALAFQNLSNAAAGTVGFASNGANDAASLTLRLFDVNSAVCKTIECSSSLANIGTSTNFATFGSVSCRTAGVLSGIRLQASSGTLTGNFRLYGIAKA